MGWRLNGRIMARRPYFPWVSGLALHLLLLHRINDDPFMTSNPGLLPLYVTLAPHSRSLVGSYKTADRSLQPAMQ